jgi:hypothetical protein
MKLREELLKENSKANCMRIVKWIGDSEERFAQLVDVFLHDEYRVVQMAAWPLSYVLEAHPELAKKHLPVLLRNLDKPDLIPAVKRNTIRALQSLPIPKKYQGLVMNHCFNYICDPTEKPAVKAFSLTVLENLSQIYPDIKGELRLVIESNMENETPAFVSRAKKILKRMA